MAIITLILGILLGWFGNWFYYRRSRDDSARARELQLQHLRTLIVGMENAGHIEAVRDAQGNVTGGHVIRPIVQTGAAAVQGQPAIVEVHTGPSTGSGNGSCDTHRP